MVFGAAFSGRPAELPGVETLVGPCVNNLPVRVRLDPEKRVIADGCAELHAAQSEIAAASVRFALRTSRSWAGVPWRLRLFDSLVVFQNYSWTRRCARGGRSTSSRWRRRRRPNYPLTLTVTPGARSS